MWQQVIVGLIVAAAVQRFCTHYLPAALRRRIVYFLARRGFDQNRMAKLFNTGASCGDGCASCGSCDSDSAPSTSSTSSTSSSASADASAPPKRVIKLHVQR
ncbi:hypothetical protein [Rugamonas apoptosis]|uniref:Uncharacterized protein n=1 Tax=Rugamonas apoptosis TaxID=2758570 RepID=A0A7W2FER3_9BURK|nr:hypothetical protein [Rugamonas apoptosis]MBA5690249.1 hypothetical protein [Rugamonas apoptosis]